MLVVLSADMEGVSQLSRAREILAACPEYWETGKPRYEEEVAAACEGLLAGRATEVVVLDNHASGNPANIAANSLPAGGGSSRGMSGTCRSAMWTRRSGRAWAARTRLIGITGNDLHEQTLGSLSGTPFLVVQRSSGHGAAEPVAGLDAIREFARTCAENVPPVQVPGETRLAASMPHGAAVEATMREGGWARAGEVEYEIALGSWQDAREPVGAAMLAAFSPILQAWSIDLTSAERARAHDEVKREQLTTAIDTWAEVAGPEWYTGTTLDYGKSRETFQPPARFRT